MPFIGDGRVQLAPASVENAWLYLLQGDQQVSREPAWENAVLEMRGLIRIIGVRATGKCQTNKPNPRRGG